MNPPASEVKPNLAPQEEPKPVVSGALEMPSAQVLTTKTEAEVQAPVVPTPVVEAPLPSGHEIDLGTKPAVQEEALEPTPEIKAKLAEVIGKEPESTEGLASLSDSLYPEQTDQAA